MNKEIKFHIKRIILIILFITIVIFVRGEINESYEKNMKILKNVNNNLKIENINTKKDKYTSEYEIQITNYGNNHQTFTLVLTDITSKNTNYEIKKNNKIIKNGKVEKEIYKGTIEKSAKEKYKIKFWQKEDKPKKSFKAKLELI